MNESLIQYFVDGPTREQLAASPTFKKEHMMPPQSRGMSLNDVVVVPTKASHKERKTLCEDQGFLKHTVIIFVIDIPGVDTFLRTVQENVT